MEEVEIRIRGGGTKPGHLPRWRKGEGLRERRAAQVEWIENPVKGREEEGEGVGPRALDRS